MDFLDPQKQKAHSRRIAIGYAVLGLVLVLGTTILVELAHGFAYKNGKVIQNGLVFLSSQPAGATIHANGQKYNQTNTHLTLPAGAYTVTLQRASYRTWQRAISMDGGVVERFDYPFLFPTKLVTTPVKSYSAAPSLATQSLDRHWLIMQGSSQDQFDLYDLTVAKPVAKPLLIPTDIFTAGTTTTGWQPIQWASDNRHVLLQRMYQKDGKAGSEFILFDRQDPSLSQNLSVAFGFNPSTIQLKNQAYDQYYVYDQNTSQIFTSTLKKPTLVPYLQNVFAFQAGTNNSFLYATSTGAPAGQVLIRLQQGGKIYTVHQSPAGSTYLLALAQYSGTPYVAVGSQAENKVYVYKDPANVLDAKMVLVPAQLLKVAAATYVSFSTSSRFAVAENGTQIAVYDVFNDKGYSYMLKTPIDAPEVHAQWLDGSHLDVVSGGKLEVLDFDGTNQQTLSPASPSYLSFLSPNSHTLYTISAANALTATSLLTPADQ